MFVICSASWPCLTIIRKRQSAKAQTHPPILHLSVWIQTPRYLLHTKNLPPSISHGVDRLFRSLSNDRSDVQTKLLRVFHITKRYVFFSLLSFWGYTRPTSQKSPSDTTDSVQDSRFAARHTNIKFIHSSKDVYNDIRPTTIYSY